MIVEEGEPGSAHSWVREETVAYEEAFKRELIEFSDCIRSGRAARTDGEDGLRDVRLAELIAAAHMATATPEFSAGDGRRAGAQVGR